MPVLWGTPYTQSELLMRVGDLRQVAEVQPFEFSDGSERGSRGIALRNAAGLSLRVLLERGMGIYDLQYWGVSLAFLSAIGVVHPSFTENAALGWLRTWPGGFLTSCGLTQVGSPCNDQGEELGLHGRLASIPAKEVSWGSSWEGDDCLLWVQGSMRESAVLGENLLLRRRIWTRLGSSRLWIEDRVENQGYASAPHMYLQHFNLGFPLVDRSARLVLPEHTTEPRDPAAAAGLGECCEFSQPVVDYAEQVFYHDLVPGSDGRVEISLINPAFNGGQGLGVRLSYEKKQYPILIEWKMMRAGAYVVGLEPANCRVDGRCGERGSGSLQTLQAGEIRTYRIEIEFFHTGA